ncbi:MAG: fumarylacetoacetate hydrolase family protein [Pseudomonadota bacterium]
MQFTFPPAATPAVPVFGTREFFPVRRIYCVGRNYAEHAKEMGGTGREAPFFFMKPADAVLPVQAGTVGEMHYPSHTADLHHEIELVVAIGTGGRDIKAADAIEHIYGYAIGIDMTRRDLQAEAKKSGRPWCVAKGFDESAPIGPIHRISQTGAIDTGTIYLNVNGTARQKGDISQLIWSVAETIEVLSGYFALQAGDLIFSGTPAGVAGIQAGDVIEAGIERLGTLSLRIV